MGITQLIFFSPGFFAIQKSFQSWNFGVWEIIEVFLFHNFEKYLLLKTNCSIYNCSNRIVSKFWNEIFFLNFKKYIAIFSLFFGPLCQYPSFIYIDFEHFDLVFFERACFLKKAWWIMIWCSYLETLWTEKMLSHFFTSLAFYN